MNQWVPAQKGRKWCGMQPGTLTLWYAISLCSPVHDAIQVPQFYKDFCFLQSHKLLVFPIPETQNGSVFAMFFCIFKVIPFFFVHFKVMVYVQTDFAIHSQFSLYFSHSRSLFILSLYFVVGVNAVWVFDDIEASYKSRNITLKNNTVQNTKITHVKAYLFGQIWSFTSVYIKVCSFRCDIDLCKVLAMRNVCMFYLIHRRNCRWW